MKLDCCWQSLALHIERNSSKMGREIFYSKYKCVSIENHSIIYISLFGDVMEMHLREKSIVLAFSTHAHVRTLSARATVELDALLSI